MRTSSEKRTPLRDSLIGQTGEFYFGAFGESSAGIDKFTSPRFTEVLAEVVIRISMDGRGHWPDNVFIEWLWRSLKHECIYLNAFETGSEARAGIGR